MLGELTTRQIIVFAEQGASVKEIADELQIEEAMVRLVLAANNAGNPEDRDINDAQLAQLRQKAFELALTAESESVAAQLTMFLIERARPAKKDLADQNSARNIIYNINQAVIGATSKFNELAEKYQNVNQEKVLDAGE